MPSNNTYVTAEGFPTHIDINVNTGHLALFHISVDNINFLGKAALPSGSLSRNQGALHPNSTSVCTKKVLHHLHPRHVPQDSGSSTTPFCLLRLLMTFKLA